MARVCDKSASSVINYRSLEARLVSPSRDRRLKRVFKIDIETCSVCGGAMRIVACIEDPVVIAKILAHLDAKAAAA